MDITIKQNDQYISLKMFEMSVKTGIDTVKICIQLSFKTTIKFCSYIHSLILDEAALHLTYHH